MTINKVMIKGGSPWAHVEGGVGGKMGWGEELELELGIRMGKGGGGGAFSSIESY